MTNITAGLEEQAIPIDVPELHPDNYRRGNVEAIAQSLSRFGQMKPIVVDKATGYVVAGNHTLRAARELGWEEIAAVVVELDADEARAYLVADNRLSDLAENDEAVLAPILNELMGRGKLDGTGFTPDDTEDMLTRMNQIPDAEPEDFEGDHAITDEQLAERFKNRSKGGALRQFVVLYTQDVGAQVDRMLTGLAKAWGVTGARDVVLEALRRAAVAESVSFDVEAAAEPQPDEEIEPAVDTVDPTGAGAASLAPSAPAPAAPSATNGLTPLEAAGLVSPPSADTPPQPATLGEQRAQEDEQAAAPEPGEPA